MNEDILFIQELVTKHVIIVNIMLAIPIIIYYINKIAHYNEILPGKKTKRYCYIIFAVLGSILFFISYVILMPYIVFPLGMVMILLLVKLCYEVSWKQALFFANDFILLPMLTGAITTNLSCVVLNKALNSIPDQWIMFELIFAFVIACILSIYICKKKIAIEYWHFFIKNSTYLKEIIIIQLYFIVTCIITTYLYSKEITVWFSIEFFITFTGVLIVYLIMIDYVVRVSVISIYENDNKELERQLELQISNYNNQVECIQEVRKFKHDFIPLINMVIILLKEEKIDNAITILEQAENISTTYFNSYKEFSNNLFVQAILNNAYHDALGKNIKFSGKVLIPNSLKIEDIDLCRIFTNLIKNAMEASYKLSSEKEINVNGYVKENWFVLVVDNNFDGHLNIQKGKIYTTKKEKQSHGLGLKIVEETVKKYGGFVKKEWDDLKWYMKIYIPFEKI